MDFAIIDGANRISPLKDAVLLLNGNERFSKRTSEYFSMIQPLQRFSKCSDKGTVYVYAYSLFPGKY